MARWKTRGVGFGLLAGACVALLDGVSILNATPAFADDTDYTALVLGHALLPQPDPTYMQEVIGTYVDPTSPFTGQPTYNIVNSPVSVFTPETDYDSGLTQGVTDLDTGDQYATRSTTAMTSWSSPLLDEHLDRDPGNDQPRSRGRPPTRLV
jgi:hypothetical protein